MDSHSKPRPGSIEARIQEQLHSFDMAALIDLLAFAGYPRSDLEFRSHHSSVHQSGLIDRIEFYVGAHRRVVIYVNLGLLSLQTPLPSFFLQRLERQETEMMADFIACFDHLLLDAQFAGLYPERDEASLPGWERTAHDRLRLLRLGSPSSLHWLFKKVYPEVELTVRRIAQRQRVATSGIRIGSASLGDGTAVGGFAEVPIGGMEVTLYCDESFCGTGSPWAVEAERRFSEQIAPLLADTQLALTVVLGIRNQSGYARLRRDSYLGFEQMKGGPEHMQKIVIYAGDLSSTNQSSRSETRNPGV